MIVFIGIFVGWVELIAIVVAGLVIPPENIGSGQAFFASSRAVSGEIASESICLPKSIEESTKQFQQAYT